MKFISELLIKTSMETLYLTGTIILVGLLLGILRTYSIKNFQRSFGSKAVMITGVIGVPIHELSHAISALLFGHRIAKVKLLQKPDVNGAMGYVEHGYNQHSIYQQVGNFFIGIAPIFGGIISITALMRFMIPQAYNRFISMLVKSLEITSLDKTTVEGIINPYIGLVKSIFSFKNFENPYFFIFLFLAICISSHISLSSADMRGASRGLGVIFIILLILNTFGLSKYIMTFNILKYNILITAFLIIAVILSLITFLISYISLIVRLR